MCQFQRVVAQFFKDYGRLVAKWPLLFILCSSLLALILTVLNLRAVFWTVSKSNDDQFRLFLPENVDSMKNLRRLRSMFPISSRDAYDIFQSSYAYVILIPTVEKNVLREEVFRFASELVERIKSIKIRVSWMEATWANLCLRKDEICLEHPLMSALNWSGLGDFQHRLSSMRQFLTYPNLRMGNHIIDNSLIFGSVTLNENGELIKASALRLPFLLQMGDSVERRRLNEMWQREFVKLVHRTKYRNISVYVSSSISWKDEMDRNGGMLISYLPALFGVLVIFCVMCCCSADWVTSQPWLGFCGVLSALLAVSSSFGLLFYFQYQYLQVVVIMPFLVLSVSADNAFLMLNAWRSTSGHWNLEERMSITMSQSAVSILITALTDGLSFAVGSASQFPAVQTKHGQNDKIPKGIVSSKFSDFLANALNNNFIKFAIILFYALYIGASVYGVTNSELRLNMSNLVPYDSYMIDERRINDAHFSDYNGYAQAVVYVENYPLHESSIISQLLHLYDRLCNTAYSSAGEFWLTEFLHYLASKQHTVTVEANFTHHLMAFLDEPEYSGYKDDFVWSEGDQKSVKSTRMYIRLRHVGGANQSTAARVLRQRFVESKFKGFITDPIVFLLADQNDAVLGCILQDAAIATGVIIVITLAFLPKFLCAIWIGLSILSINIGVLGFLALWHVQVDVVSMMTTVMSVGLSVDYVAHVTYQYLITRNADSRMRLRNALDHAGWSSIQSAAATVLGASTLAFVDSYMVRTFVKTVILVVSLGLLHGLLFLPVALSAFIPADQYLETTNYTRVRTYFTATIRALDSSRSRQRRLALYFTRTLPSMAATQMEPDQMHPQIIRPKVGKPKIRDAFQPILEISEHSSTADSRTTSTSAVESSTSDGLGSSSSLAWTSLTSKHMITQDMHSPDYPSTENSLTRVRSPVYDSPPLAEEIESTDLVYAEKFMEMQPGELVEIVLQPRNLAYRSANQDEQQEYVGGLLMKTFQPITQAHDHDHENL